MDNVVPLFPNKGFKLSHEEAMRLAAASAFPPDFFKENDQITVDEFLDDDYQIVSKQYFADLMEQQDILEAIIKMSLWDRIKFILFWEY